MGNPTDYYWEVLVTNEHGKVIGCHKFSRLFGAVDFGESFVDYSGSVQFEIRLLRERYDRAGLLLDQIRAPLNEDMRLPKWFGGRRLIPVPMQFVVEAERLVEERKKETSDEDNQVR